MKYGIVGPSEGEVAKFVAALENKKERVVSNIKVYQGTYKNLDISVAISGICKVNASIAAMVLVREERCDALVVCGVSGGIDPLLKIGDTVICSRVAYHDVDPNILVDDPPYMGSPWFESDADLVTAAEEALGESINGYKIYTGKAVTGEAFVADEGRQEIIDGFDPLCTDMETAAVAHVAYMNKIPFVAFRSITDTAEKSGMENFHENYLASSATAQDCLMAFLGRVSE